MKKSFVIILLSALVAAPVLSSCNKWLDVKSSDEVFADDAFATTAGYRSALTGVYRQVASANLWGQELTWGFLSAMSWNYQAGYAVVKYRAPLQKDVYADANTLKILDNVWSSAYTAVANCNAILSRIAGVDSTKFEYSFEKNMIMAEARGLRALLHLQMLQMFAPAPVKGVKTPCIPYVKDYPDLRPSYNTVDEVIANCIEDLKYAEETLYPIDVEEFFNKAKFSAGGMNMLNMDYFLFQAVGNYNTTGQKRDNAIGDGFFAYRGYRFNYWSALALLARTYSYARDYTNAEIYADKILEDWTGTNLEGTGLFKLNADNTAITTSYGANKIDGKRRPEPLLAFWNDKVTDLYSTANGPSYGRIVEPKYLFAGDETTDYRYTTLYNTANYRYRVWDGQDAAYTQYANQLTYSCPLLPVIELPEIYYIKAECQAHKGAVTDAVATVKLVRDARACTAPQSATDEAAFLELLVNEAQRDFITRGTTFQFLKKLDWPVMYNGTPAGKTLPAGWYVFPIPESETAYY